jgi:peptidoglycan hydrolase-like protein with peptidoglycan-binding domain
MRAFILSATLLLVACGAADPPTASVATTTTPVVRTDVARMQSVAGAITYGTPSPVVVLGPGGVITWLPDPGAVVGRGQRLYSIDARPTMLMLGSTPAYRALTVGTTGADVKELEQNLLALGYANSANLIADGNFTWADAAAVRRWQQSLGVSQTGFVDLGTVVFSPAPLRVSPGNANVGAPVGPGAQILNATPDAVHVSVALDTAYIAFLHLGNAVRVTLPDLSTVVSGHVTSIASTANVQMVQNQPSRPTVAVTIGVDDPRKIAGYDQAPVQVGITLEVHHNVLAVPVLALLAEPNQTYAVRVVHGSSRTFVTVTPGLEGSNDLIEVSGSGLSAGDLVEVPTT